MASDMDPNCHRDLPESKLMAVIEGRDPGCPDRKINRVRLQIMDYILRNWEGVSPLLSCPARSKDPRSCFQCTDVQVAECALTNPQAVENEEK